tara:strand:+ start:702 stop:1244 length:543 start_codon:yes stop_codon:yes gene_type:complete
VATFFLVISQAFAMDSNSVVAINQFNAICVRYLAKPEDIRTWANNNYTSIRDPDVLATVVGRISGGAAWRLPSPTGRKLTLSLRGDGKTCAIWSEAADPEDVEIEFRNMVAGAAREGIIVKTTTDSTLPTRSGLGRLLSMSVMDSHLGSGYLFTFIAGDLFAGAPISLSMQMVRLDAPGK